MPDGTWSLADAKAKFSEFVERARTEGQQHLTKNGKDAVVLMSADEYRRLSETASTLAKAWQDRRFGVLSDQEHDEIFVRDKGVGRPPIEF